MEFEETTKNEYEAINNALHQFFDARIERAKTLSPTHVQYYEYIKEYIMRGGKRFRPISVIIAYRAVTGKTPPANYYQAACTVEILHNASLLHDDLIDHDETRRGGPTFHAKYREWYKKAVSPNSEKAAHFGMTTAILGGDSLMNLGEAAISEADLDHDISAKCHAMYEQAFEGLVEGVLLEMSMISNPKASTEMYLEMIRLKTAILLEKALLIGGIMGRASDSQLEALSEFGVKVGQAFQIQDDILGSFGNEDVTGKAADGDIKEAKKTMLVIQAGHLCNASQKERLSQLLGKDGITDEEVDEVRDIFRDSGALDGAAQLMNKLHNEGQKALDKANPPFNAEYKQYMLDLSDFLVKRDY